MCRVCVEWELGKLTNKEALRNLGELIGGPDGDLGDEHYFQVVNRIMDDELPVAEPDGDLDAAWYREMHRKSGEE